MTDETKLRERICLMAKSLYDRGLTHGSTGNISARLDDGHLLVTPTGSSFGFLDPADISLLDAQGQHLSGKKPTKELPLHSAFYGVRQAPTGAVVHLHSHHTVALSLLDGLDPDNVLPPLTPYGLMQLGHVRLLPYFQPGDPAMGDAVAALDPNTSAVILSNHGPVVAGATLDKTVFAMEELEATARLALEAHRGTQRPLTKDQIARLVAAFNIDV
ncbi:MAG: aldolase [Pseudomonadota bacterium]